MEQFLMLLLLLTSLVGVAFIVERAVALRASRVIPESVTSALAACHGPGDVPALERVCRQHPSSLSRLLLSAITHMDWPREENADALQTAARHEVVRLERGLVVLEVVVGIAPLLGLTGTIFGMMTLFGDIGKSATLEANALATGISTILNATLLGLLIAIPSLIAWNFFNAKVERLAVEMETLCTDFLRRQYRQRGAA
jgi:biopolymer transport protein ExbB